MKKRTLISFSVIICLLLLATLVYILFPRLGNYHSVSSTADGKANDSYMSIESSQMSNTLDSSNDQGGIALSSEAAGLLNSFGQIGEEYTIHSRYFSNGTVRDESAPYLGWDGDLSICVNSVTVTDYSPDSLKEDEALKDSADQLQKWSEGYLDFCSNPKVVRICASLTNVNAENKNSVRYQFYGNMFRLASEADLEGSFGNSKYVWYDAIFEHDGESVDYWAFLLEAGETINMELLYLVQPEYLNQTSPFLGITLSSSLDYGVLLGDIGSKEGDQ